MAYLGNQPLLSTMRTSVEGTAYANQIEIPVPGGLVSGMVDVVVNGADLARADYDDSNGMSVKLYVPMNFGDMFKITAWTPNQTVVNAGGQLAGFRNQIINGNFDFWQRGTSLGAGGDNYLADRWLDSASGTTTAPSQQVFALGNGVIPNEPTYFHRCVIASSAGAGNFGRLVQRLEGVRTLAGQQVVISFWAKADANKNIAFEASQFFGSGGSTGVTGIGTTTCALTTAWKQFKIAFTLPSISGKSITNTDFVEIGWWFDAGSNWNSRTNSLGQQSGTFDIAQVQLEAGSVATNFEMRPKPLEMVLCQRYFEKSYDDTTAPGSITSAGREEEFRNGTTGVTQFGAVRYKVTKRASASITLYNDSSGASGQAAQDNGSSIAIGATSGGMAGFRTSWTNTTGRFGASYHWAASAEL